MSEFTQGVCQDGAAILRDGIPVTVEDVVSLLNQLTQAQQELERVMEVAINDDVIDLVRCGIGGNYGGKYYDNAIAKIHQPLVELADQLKQQAKEKDGESN